MLAAIKRQYNNCIAPHLRDGGWIAAAATGLFTALCAVLIEGTALGLRFDNLKFVAQFNWLLFFSVFLLATALVTGLCALWKNQAPISAALPASCLGFMLLLAGGMGGGMDMY